MDMMNDATRHIAELEAWLQAHPQDSQSRRDRVAALERWKENLIRVKATRAVWVAQRRDLLARCDKFGRLAYPQPK